tara:strand:+ start:162 stop:353 length:192 start_codon:yes stop_codon:yes gene_type:complete
MKASDIKGKKASELNKLKSQKQEELREVRFGLSGAAKSTSSIRELRRDIARINTELRAQEIAS